MTTIITTGSITRQIGTEYESSRSGQWVRYDRVSGPDGTEERAMIFVASRQDCSGAYLGNGLGTLLNGRQMCNGCYFGHSHSVNAHEQVARDVAVANVANWPGRRTGEHA